MAGSVTLFRDRSIWSGPCQAVEEKDGQKPQEKVRFSWSGEKEERKDRHWHGQQMPGTCLSQLPASSWCFRFSWMT